MDINASSQPQRLAYFPGMSEGVGVKHLGRAAATDPVRNSYGASVARGRKRVKASLTALTPASSCSEE